MNENILDLLEGFVPEITEDDSIDFSQPIKCGALVVIKEGGRNRGEKKDSGEKYDFLYLKMQIAEVVDGEEKSIGRFINKNYALIDKIWKDGKVGKAVDNVKKLLRDLHTMGYDFNVPQTIEEEDFYEALTVHLGGLVDKTAYMRCYHFADKDDPEKRVQVKNIVNELKKRSEVKKDNSNVPF